jgi:hypothetical protein
MVLKRLNSMIRDAPFCDACARTCGLDGIHDGRNRICEAPAPACVLERPLPIGAMLMQLIILFLHWNMTLIFVLSHG